MQGFKVQEKWQFCSDHLPLGLTVEHGGQPLVRMVSWNVLNTAYMRWIYKDEQGMSRSRITELDKTEGSKTRGLTLRDEEVVQTVLALAQLYHIIGLQESSVAVSKRVAELLATEGWMQVPQVTGMDKSQIVTFYNTNIVKVVNATGIQYAKQGDSKGIQLTHFELVGNEDALQVHFVNTHVPFGAAGRDELAAAVNKYKYRRSKTENVKKTVIVTVGDTNADSANVGEALGPDWTHVESYLSHVNARNQPVDYDCAHFTLVPLEESEGETKTGVVAAVPEIGPVKEMVELLTGWKKNLKK
eukprot:TRINITY_DN33315_c0_g1_i1.p1 TRINITY_DN33315_c0_g1~~TRINITY_DN33315_c0_g1_i1.p1  ORF type:complete len:301 (+),score=42.73 TRINITY_DN33315_c0_g1_i1:127-1029(+)